MKPIKDHKVRNDIILAAAVLLLAGIFFAVTELSKSDGSYAVVMTDGAEIARYPLDTPAEIRLEREDGGYNVLVISDGHADITEASCPDKICVNQHQISRTGETITCLPNKTVIRIIGGGTPEVDIIS